MKKLFNLFKKDHASETEVACVHNFLLVAKSYAPPRQEIPEGISDRLAEKSLLGVTTYMWTCGMCGAIKKEEIIGSDGNQLEEVLIKADTLGVQYVERDKKVFAIARVPKDDERIPIK